MMKLLLWVGRTGGLVGVALVVVAVLTRAAGQWHLGSMSVGSLLEGGVASMVLAVLAYTASMADRPRT